MQDQVPGRCWIWTGRLNQGYGQVDFDGRSWMAHRVVYEHFTGPIAPGLELDHLCYITACCNPAHLEPVTRAENIARQRPRRPQSRRNVHVDSVLLTTTEVAERFRVDTATVRRWVIKGQLTPAVRTPGGHMRFNEDDINAFKAAS